MYKTLGSLVSYVLLVLFAWGCLVGAFVIKDWPGIFCAAVTGLFVGQGTARVWEKRCEYKNLKK